MRGSSQVPSGSSEGAICIRCGFVHTFMGNAYQWVKPEDVKPEDLPYDPFAEGPKPDQ